MGSRFRIGGLLIALVVGLVVRMSNRHSTGEEYLAKSKELVSQIPSYKAHPEYVDWLVTQAHDECFEESYTEEFGRRGRGGKIIVDEYGYLSDLFRGMIRQAETDRQPDIVKELTQLQKEMLDAS